MENKIEELDDDDPWWRTQPTEPPAAEYLPDIPKPASDNPDASVMEEATDEPQPSRVEELDDAPPTTYDPSTVGEKFVDLFYRLWNRIFTLQRVEINGNAQSRLLSLFANDCLCSVNDVRCQGAANTVALLTNSLGAIQGPVQSPSMTRPVVELVEFVPNGATTSPLAIGCLAFHILITGNMRRRFLSDKQSLHASSDMRVEMPTNDGEEEERSEWIGKFSHTIVLVLAPVTMTFVVSNSILRGWFT